MQRAVAFFGGAVLGGIISAASGLDLFEADRRVAREEARLRAEDELQKTKGLLVRAKEMLAKSDERIRELIARPGSRDEGASKADSRDASRDDKSRLLEDRIARGQAEAGQHRVEIVRLQGDLVMAREALVSAALESKQCNTQLHEQLLRFFARERDADDAAHHDVQAEGEAEQAVGERSIRPPVRRLRAEVCHCRSSQLVHNCVLP